MPDFPPERSERDLHDLFVVLREHAVEVVGDFGERLNQRLQQLDDVQPEYPPTVRALVSSAGIELLNLLSGLLGINYDERKNDEP